MTWTIAYRPYAKAPKQEIDWRCFFGIHAYTPWTYRDEPPMYKVCKRCGEWVWHTDSWDAWYRHKWEEARDE